MFISKPIFIPVGQKAFMKVRLQLRPFARPTITETQVHDALASFRMQYPKAESFEVFDGENRRQIDLPIPRSME